MLDIIAIVVSLIVFFGTFAALRIDSVKELKLWKRDRAGIDRPQWPEEAGAYDTNPPTELDYNYIDWLEARLKVGAFDPDRIEVYGPPKGKSAAALNAQAAYRVNKAQRRRDLETHQANKREDIRRAKAEQLMRDRARARDLIWMERVPQAKWHTEGEHKDPDLDLTQYKTGGILFRTNDERYNDGI